jgi:hypothetical protein
MRGGLDFRDALEIPLLLLTNGLVERLRDENL